MSIKQNKKLHKEYYLCSLLYYIGTFIFLLNGDKSLFILSAVLPILSIIYFYRATKIEPIPKCEYPKISWKIKVLLKILRIKVVPIKKYYPKKLAVFHKNPEKPKDIKLRTKYIPRGCSHSRHEIAIYKEKAHNYTYLHEIGHSLVGGYLCCTSHTEYSAHFIASALAQTLNIPYNEPHWDTSIDQLAMTNPDCVRLKRRKHYMNKDTVMINDLDGKLEKQYDEQEKRKKEIKKVAKEALKILERGF